MERTVAGDGRRLVQHHACQVGCNGVIANQLDGEVGDSLVHNARSVGRVSFDGGVVESEDSCARIEIHLTAHSVNLGEVVAVGFNHNFGGYGFSVHSHRQRIGVVCRIGRNVDVASLKFQAGDVAD